MHMQGRLKYTTEPISFSFLVFIVYKTDSYDKKKGHTIIQIQKPNNLILPDFYPLFL